MKTMLLITAGLVLWVGGALVVGWAREVKRRLR
jgi:hypothetical protein